MGVMSGLEKFIVNRSNARNSKSLFESIKRSLVLPEKSSLLELGAGRGALSLLLYEHYKPIRSVVSDYDPLQLEGAKSYFAEKFGTVPKVLEFRLADALNLSFEDGSFDAVFASHVLHHVETHEWNFERIPKALDEIERVLKQDGSFVFEEMFKKNEIANHLQERGFREMYSKGNFFSNKFYVYRKTSRGTKEPSTP